MTTSHGLGPRDIASIQKALGSFPAVEQAMVFGSRAKGTHKKASDVDLAVKGSGITDDMIKRLSAILNEDLPLPYFFDVVRYESINNPELTAHIDRVGKVIYPEALVR